MFVGQAALAACYLLVFLVCVVQVAVIWWHGHQLQSFRVCFLVLSSSWTLLKGILWLNSAEALHSNVAAAVILDKLPLVGQLLSYMFFLVFCGKQVHSEMWQKYQWRCWALLLVVALVLVAIVVALGLVTAAGNRKSMGESSASGGGGGGSIGMDQENVLEESLSAVVFWVLAVLMAVYGWLIWRRHKDEQTNKISFKTGFIKKDQRVSGIVPVLAAVSLIFSARTLYDVLIATGVATHGKITKGPGGPAEASGLQYAIPYYLVADIFPTLLILLYFPAIPRKPPRPRHIPEQRRRDSGGGSILSGLSIQGESSAKWKVARQNGPAGVHCESGAEETERDRNAVSGAAYQPPKFDPFKSSPQTFT